MFNLPTAILKMSRRLAPACLFFISASIFSTNLTAATTSYKMGPGDEISIQVYQEDDLSMTIRLGQTGEFNYPYLGVLVASGKTANQLTDEITKGLLQDILVKPSVNVSVISYRNFYIGGEVKRSGGYPYQPGLTIKQAITLAGGVTEWASSSKYEILREGSTAPITATNNTEVAPGDTITVLEGIF